MRGVLVLLGLAVALLVALAFTPYPWRVYTWMGVDDQPMTGEPAYIVLMGGGGIPSESGLMRSYEAAETARRFPGAQLIVAMTAEEDEATSSTKRMFAELTMRGVALDRLILEGKGRNTREQALSVFRMVDGESRQPVMLLVTSPDHMKRSILAFRRVGFEHVHGASTFGVSVNADLTYKSDELGKPSLPVPDVGHNLVLRYVIWNNLAIEGKIIHEFTALAYYKLMGWI